MTYFGFLFRFLILPILGLAVLLVRDHRRGLSLPMRLRGMAPWLAIGVTTAAAVAYTTPWDNYLVATHVWWYFPERVAGITLGYVPLEEYLFFVLQTVLSGLWFLYLAPRLSVPEPRATAPGRHRLLAVLAGGVIWLMALILFVAGVPPATYLALELGWMLPPILVQLAFGADVLWGEGKRVSLPLATALAYYSAADALGIRSGIWMISPRKTLGVLLAGVLPIEEFIFFMLTNALIVFSIVLLLSREGRDRFDGMMAWARGKFPRNS